MQGSERSRDDVDSVEFWFGWLMASSLFLSSKSRGLRAESQTDEDDDEENDDHLDTQKVSRKVGKWRRRSEEASNATHLHVLRGHFITSCPASSFDLSYIQILHLSKSNSWHKGNMP